MTATTSYSTLVSIKITQDKAGVFVATSPELPGLLVVSKDRLKLETSLVPNSIADLYLASGVRMFVSPLEPREQFLNRWVAMPYSVAKKAMDEANAV